AASRHDQVRRIAGNVPTADAVADRDQRERQVGAHRAVDRAGQQRDGPSSADDGLLRDAGQRAQQQGIDGARP
ncbi:hypothetical protein OAG94_00240, partial [bacterium]|nr:hypothetical protein [bacterium]